VTSVTEVSHQRTAAALRPAAGYPRSQMPSSLETDAVIRSGSVLRRLYERIDHLVHEMLKFGTVGAVAFLVDVGGFNVLRYGPLDDKPLTAKTISVVAATMVAYLGNRHWTFRHRGRWGIGRESALFFLFNAVGLGVALSCLGISHYLLGFTSRLADNIAANVIGLGLGTIFRFWSYRRWVFPARGIADRQPLEPVANAA
jgi:putative flippase GtrA